jgi:putative methyltransferase (TIGR04325 family)
MKKLAKRVMPEFLLQLARVIRETGYRMRLTYSGVYASFEDVAKVGGGYEDDEWPITAAQYSRWAIAKNESGFIPAAVSNETALLPLLISVSRATRILDFGGATGFSYIAAKYGVMRDIDRYVIVEHPNVCAHGRELFKDDLRVEFLERIPQEQFDLVLIGGALQYVSNYKGLLRILTDLKPRWILITKLPAGENVTFVSAQVNLPRMKFTSWLFNAKELVSIMDSLNYKLIFRSANDGRVNQEKLDPKYRLEHQGNLLFEAASSSRESRHGN